MEADVNTVLVLEDDAAARQTTCETLHAYGYESVAAQSVHEAVDWLEAGHLPCAIVLDLVMAHDGVNFVELLRGNHAWSQVPIIITTGLAMRAESGAAKLGISPERYLLKPFDPEKLIGLLRDCCATGTGTAQKAR